jgi:subtilisin family serine protease
MKKGMQLIVLLVLVFLTPKLAMAENYQWALEKIQVFLAWEIAKGEGVVVALIDGGVGSLAEFREKLWINEDEIANNRIDDDNNGFIDDMNGWDFQDNDNTSSQGSSLRWHGAFVGGIISSLTVNEAYGRRGVAVSPEAKLMDIRLTDENGHFEGEKILFDCINYAVDNNADIINLSIACTSRPFYRTQTAINAAYEKGIIVVAGVGNKASTVQWPAAYESVIAVTAVDCFNRLYPKANTGAEVDFAAPGVDVYSIWHKDNLLAKTSGTSCATAYVTGTVALMLSINPELTPEEVYDILEETSEDLGAPGKDEKFGHGLINAYNAVLRVQELLEENPANDGQEEETSSEGPPEELE